MRFSMAVVAGVCGVLINSGRADEVPPVVAAPAGIPAPITTDSPRAGERPASPENYPPELPAEGLQPGAVVFPGAGSGARHGPLGNSASSELLSRKEAELECLQEEVDRLREQTGQTRAVMVRLLAFEFSRASLGNRARELDALLGLWTEGSSVSKESSPFLKAPEPQEGASAFVRPASFDRPETPLRTLGVSLVDGDVSQSLLFRRLREGGLLDVLGQPALTTVSGRPASLHVGGQFPIPVPGEHGTSSVVMKPFGQQLEIAPEIRPGGHIRLQVRYEKSYRDFARTIEVGGVRVPELVTRSINTEIEMRSGQTAVLSRIGQRHNSSTGAAGEKPVPLDSVTIVDDDRELIVLVTPELLHDTETPSPMRLRSLMPDPDAAASAYHPSEEYQYYPAMPVLPRGLRR